MVSLIPFEKSMSINYTEKEKGLELKKSTLLGWTKIILNEGFIDIDRYNKMIDKINKLKK